MINKETKELAPVPQFLNIPGLVTDMQKITDTGRGKWFSNTMMGLALLKNYNPFGGPPSLTLSDILKKFDKSFGLSGKSYGKVAGDRTMEDIEKRRRILELPVHRRNVVPGSVQLRLPPHRDVHHSLRDAARRDLVLCV